MIWEMMNDQRMMNDPRMMVDSFNRPTSADAKMMNDAMNSNRPMSVAMNDYRPIFDPILYGIMTS